MGSHYAYVAIQELQIGSTSGNLFPLQQPGAKPSAELLANSCFFNVGDVLYFHH